MSNVFDHLDDNGRHVPFEFSTDDVDMDSWDERNDNPEHFGPLPGELTPIFTEPSTESITLINDEATGSKQRDFYRNVLNFEGPDAFMRVVDQVNIREAEHFEQLVMNEIKSIRKEFQLCELFVSDLLTQAARAQSQYYSGNCTRDEDNMPFASASYVVPKAGRQSLKRYASRLVEVLKESEVAIGELTDENRSEIGIGLWGSSNKFIVTIAKF